ncbi:MAG: Capsule assembly Wzi family protein [Mitsuokella multacida]|jgi:hypothetical protein
MPIEVYVAPEFETLTTGEPMQDTIKLHSTTATLAVMGGDDDTTQGYRGPNAHYQPFAGNNNGHRYGQDGNVILEADLSGNIGHETAVALRPRFSYDNDADFEAKLDEGYVKTRVGVMAFELGKQPLLWGQGKTGSLVLGNNMKPLTAAQIHLTKPQEIRGFFKFLGEVDVHAFYAYMDEDRADKAKQLGRTDYNDASLLGVRLDITPTDYFTLGLTRVSMLGGDGSQMSGSDWKDWLRAKNSVAELDRWNDIGGADFRLKFPGVQLYSEIYGEDAGGLTPTERAYRYGVYLPQLTKDGSWDLTVEAVKTNPHWYVHHRYQNGWTYGDNIIGDAMGRNARKYYVGVKHYLPHETNYGLYAMRTEFDCNFNLNPTITEAGLTGQMRMDSNLLLSGTLGYVKVENSNYTNKDKDNIFALASMQWRY